MSTKTSQPMSVYQAIYGRRSAWKFSGAPVDRMAIERMLDAAVWAPNHRLTEPWRFFVLEQDSPERLKAAELAYEFQLGRTGDERRAEAAKQKVLEPPVVMYVYTIPGPNDETTRRKLRFSLHRSPQHFVGRSRRGAGSDLGDWGRHAAPGPESSLGSR